MHSAPVRASGWGVASSSSARTAERCWGLAHSGTPSRADPARRRWGPLWTLFTDEDSLRTVDVLRLVYVAVAIAALVLTEAGRTLYRPYIYETGVEDFGIADSIGNLGGIVVQVFASLAILNSRASKALRVIGFLVAGYILYEIIQPYLPRGVFDWKDVFGTILGGIIAALLVLVLRRVVRPNRVLRRF